MKVSSKSRYALMALVELDLRMRGKTQPVRLNDLARERGIPEQFLEQLFAGLRRAGLVTGHRGVGGGFTFARRPDRLTVLAVVEALDGSPDGTGASPRAVTSRSAPAPAPLARGRRRVRGRARPHDRERPRRARASVRRRRTHVRDLTTHDQEEQTQ